MNPWYEQARLMCASEQQVSDDPCVTNTSVLYLALQMEELGELLRAVHSAISAHERSPAGVSPLGEIGLHLAYAAGVLEADAKQIRNILSSTPQFYITPTQQQAVTIADGTTDVAVVNCGFAVASGIDGDRCYNEVVSSNLSKANPQTGKIEKDASGKWIKGKLYHAPDLHSVLFPPLLGDSK